MENNEISIHEARVFHFLKSNPQEWFTNKEITQAVTNVAARTVRQYTLKLVNLGILDQAELFPNHHYKFAEKFDKRNPAYAKRLAMAVLIFGSKSLL